MGKWMLSAKIVAASAAAFTSAVALRLATPPVADFLVAKIPTLYQSISSWLTPPYLYFIVNGIIISIAATSRFQKNFAADNHPTASAGPTLSTPPLEMSAEADLRGPSDDDNSLPEFFSPSIGDGNGLEMSDSAAEMEGEVGFVISRSSWSPRRRGSSENLQEKSAEKPPVSARLGRRKSLKASPEGKALRVSRPRKQETLENTWRTITDGRQMPLNRHLKKADTWDSHINSTPPDTQSPAIRKSETLAGGLSPPPSSGVSPATSGKIRREPSLGQDDLNRRVEAFIKKFNEEMRLQRQESLQHYMDMINCSVK